MRTLQEIRAVMAENSKNNEYLYEGLESSEIAHYNGVLMFGENDEAFPDQDEWPMWVV